MIRIKLHHNGLHGTAEPIQGGWLARMDDGTEQIVTRRQFAIVAEA